MANLSSVIRSIFYTSYKYSAVARQWMRNPSYPSNVRKYLEIPIHSDVFELPLLAFQGFLNMLALEDTADVIAVNLRPCSQTSSYKSLESIMKDVLSTPLQEHMCKVQIEGCPNIYYTTFGAVFNEDLKPLMMLSWVMERKPDEDGTMKYYFKKPLLRLDPYSCIAKEDPLQRFLAGKMLTTTLDANIDIPVLYNHRHFITILHRENLHAKAEIDECPFIIRETDVPSVSTTNESLLQLAADHIDEMLQ